MGCWLDTFLMCCEAPGLGHLEAGLEPDCSGAGIMRTAAPPSCFSGSQSSSGPRKLLVHPRKVLRERLWVHLEELKTHPVWSSSGCGGGRCARSHQCPGNAAVEKRKGERGWTGVMRVRRWPGHLGALASRFGAKGTWNHGGAWWPGQPSSLKASAVSRVTGGLAPCPFLWAL